MKQPPTVATVEDKPNCAPVPGSAASTWRMHVLGMDDLHPKTTDELEVLRGANALNIFIARERLKHPNDDNWPWGMAVVEKDGLDYSVGLIPKTEQQNVALSHADET